MPFLTRLLPSFLVSWLLTFTLASLFHSQYVVNQLGISRLLPVPEDGGSIHNWFLVQ